MTAIYNTRLVILSIVIAIFAAYTALDLAGRITVSQKLARKLWLIGGATVMGIGIWSMHFVAMLAYNLPIAMAYDLPLVLISMTVAIVASGAALFVASRQRMSQLNLLGGGMFMGLGITAMHYSGMEAMRLEAIAHYNPRLVALSIIIALGASLVALWLAFHLRGESTAIGTLRKIGSATVMGCAIAGMHYTGMAAVSYEPTNLPMPPSHTMGNSWMAIAIGIATLIILVLSLVASLVAGRVSVELTRAETLRQSEERLRSLLQNASDIIAILDSYSTVKYISASIQRVLGYEPTEWIDKQIDDLVNPNDRVFARSLFDRAFLHPYQDVVMKFRLRHADGTWRDFEAIAKNLLREPSIAGIVITYRNITERKHHEAEIQRTQTFLTSIVENIPAMIFVKDAKNLQFVLLNKAGEDLVGYSREELVGRSDHDFFLPEEADAFAAKDREVLESRTLIEIPDEPLHTRHRGSRILHTKKIPIIDQDGKPQYLLGISEDVTERKQAETEIRKALEKERELSELKSRFVAMASHEFRTPLAGIMASSDLLKHFGHKFNEEERRNRLIRIQTEVKHMTQLLDDVLFIGKAEAGKITFNPITLDLASFCRELLAEIEYTIGIKHTFTFSCKSCLLAEADEKLLRQILVNLLSNAIKYSAEGSTIDFEVACEGKSITFKVTDEGIGIPAADRLHLFEAFHRASNVSNLPGTGLGLAIVKNAVELHGGAIAVKSELGQGTIFTVLIPRNRSKDNSLKVARQQQ